MSDVSSNNRVVKNTLMLYFRMFISIVVSLYTSRVILQVLGVEDYGIYALVGGVTAMFSFINASMSGASSRYLSYELGKGNQNNINLVFNSSVLIHAIISIIFIIGAETLGLWFVYNKLTIPLNSYYSAIYVYQFSIVGTVITILMTPFNSLIIAKERMSIYTYVEIANVVLKLIIVYLLLVIPFNKLITYSALYLGVTILTSGFYGVYCYFSYEESHLKRIRNFSFLKPMLSFSGWNLIGDIGYAIRQNGSNLVLNMFFGPVVNAANGIAMSVQGTIMGFATNATTALRPPIIKSFAAKEYGRTAKLLSSASVLALILMLTISCPIIINAPYILKIWLKTVPEYTIGFTCVGLITGAVSCASNVTYIGLQAAEKMKIINLVRFILYSASLLIQYFLLKMGLPAISAYLIILCVIAITTILNVLLLRRVFKGFSAFLLLRRYGVVMLFSGLCCVAVYLICMSIEGFMGLISSSVLFLLIYLPIVYYCILNMDEKTLIITLVSKLVHKNV